MIIDTDFKYTVVFSTRFKKEYKRVKKQGKDINKLKYVIDKLANGELLDQKYKNHNLKDDGEYVGCKECHIEPDWLLIYKYIDNELILLLVSTGSHSDLF